MPTPAVPSSTSLSRTVAALLSLVFLAVLIRTAWIADDALITLRTVLNVTHGYGLVYNIAERVQTFTHPLWMLLLTASYTIAGNVYHATFALSIGTSLAVFWMAVRRAGSTAQAVFVAVVLVCSRAFVDFSTSGLENPLSHLLLGAFVITALRASAAGRPRLVALWLLTSLLYLTRPDDVVIVIPLLVVATFRAGPWRSAIRPVVTGLLPAIAWTLFAIVYYGVPFPNTAYAKLANGIPKREIVTQGFVYLFDSFDRDPLTGVTIAFGTVIGLATSGAARMLAIGLLLHLAYVISIGGDFMAGRFMSVPFFGAVTILGWVVTRAAGTWVAATVVLAGVAVVSGGMPLMSDSRYTDPHIRANGITDERGVFFKDRSLLVATRRKMISPTWPRYSGEPADMNVLETCGLMGATGLDFGPSMHLLDECALADPLLARLPALFNSKWRIGHFKRMVPEGYRESLTTLDNRITDPAVRALYDDVRLATRSRVLISTRRFAAIWRLNARAADRTIDRHFYRHGGSVVPLARFAATVPDGTTLDDPRVHVLHRAVAITCEDTPGRRYMDVSLESNNRYEITFLRRDVIVAIMELGPVPQHRRKPGVASYTENLPNDATIAGFDTIVIAPITREGGVGVGHLLLDGYAPTDAELRRRVAVRDATPR